MFLLSNLLRVLLSELRCPPLLIERVHLHIKDFFNVLVFLVSCAIRVA